MKRSTDGQPHPARTHGQAVGKPPVDPLTCVETFERLDDYLHRALTPEELVRVEEHIAICAECASEYQFEQSWIDEVRSKMQLIKLPAALRRRIERQIEDLKTAR